MKRNTSLASILVLVLTMAFSLSPDISYAEDVDMTSDIPPFTVRNVTITDGGGNQLDTTNVETRILVKADITNNHNEDQKFALVVTVFNEKGTALPSFWLGGEILVGQSFTLAQSWTPTEPGTYTLQVSLRESVVGDELAPPVSTTITVLPEGAVIEEKVPGWIKDNAKWWADGQIEDSDFTNGIEHLINEKIIDIPDLPPQASDTAEQHVPDWIKNNAGWWAEGLISEDDFVNGIKYLVEHGIIRV